MFGMQDGGLLGVDQLHGRAQRSPGVAAVLAMGAGLLLFTGCGPDFGAFVYTLGLYPSQKIAAEYNLSKGNMLVLVDDVRDLIQPTTARDALVDEMAKRLSEHQFAERVTTNEEIARLRQKEPRLDERGLRELYQ